MSLRDSEGSDEGEWLDVENDEESVVITSFFGSHTFPSVSTMLEDSKKHHGFDFAACLKRLRLDFHGAVKLVNYVRGRVRDGQSLPQEIAASDFDDERYLQPVLPNDALIFSLDDVLESAGEEEEAGVKARDVEADALVAQNRELKEELEKVRSQFANYRVAVEKTLETRWGDDEPAPVKEKDDSKYYFESYAAHGRISPGGPCVAVTVLTRD